MYSVIERMMTLYPSHTSTAQPEPYKCIYTERIKCFEKLAQLQKDLKAAEEQVSKVRLFDGMGHHNALNNVLARTADYKEEYVQCEKIMKY